MKADIGLYDDPENQKQGIYTIDFSKAGNILLFGAPNTGKTTFLQTLVYSLIRGYSAEEINLYIFQFSAHKFSVFEKAPQVGGIVKDNDDNERIDKLFVMLGRLLSSRKQKFGEIGFEQYASMSSAEPVPAVYIMIDGFASYMTKVGDRYHGLISRIAKEGINYGIYLVISAGGISGSEIPNSLAQNFRTIVCMELNNTYDYSNYMRKARMRIRPEGGIKGRGIAYVGERVLEFQTALAVSADNDQTLNDKISDSVQCMNEAWDREIAAPIPEIPDNPIWSDYCRLASVQKMFRDSRLLPVGYDSHSADVVGLDLSHYYVMLLTGAKKKGKTNALKVLMMSAKEKGAQVIVVDFEKKLTGIATEIKADHITSEVEWGKTLSHLLKDEVIARNRLKGKLRGMDAEDSEIYEAMLEYTRIFIFIDDLTQFIDHIIHPKEEGVAPNIVANMEMIIERGALHNIFWVVTVDKDSIVQVSSQNIYKLFISDRKGLHFGGAVHTTSIAGMNFDNHDRRTVDTLRQAGRAMVPVDNDESITEIVMPMVKVKNK